jgi:hypothetical protein
MEKAESILRHNAPQEEALKNTEEAAPWLEQMPAP